MNVTRHGTAGLSLVEMLVVLALFGIVTGAVALSVPGGRTATASETAAQALAAHVDRALGVALATGDGFGILHDGAALRFVQKRQKGAWTPHSDTTLAQVKLSVARARISINVHEVFVVSDQLIPAAHAPFKASFGATDVVFDGARVRIERGP